MGIFLFASLYIITITNNIYNVSNTLVMSNYTRISHIKNENGNILETIINNFWSRMNLEAGIGTKFINHVGDWDRVQLYTLSRLDLVESQ